jgi:hypothetical protein
MMPVFVLLGVVGLALIVGWGIRFGWRLAACGQRHRAAERDVAIDREADRAERGLYARWSL